MSGEIPGFDRAQAAYEAMEPDDVGDDCGDLECGECPACIEADRLDDYEARAEQAREDARHGD